MVGLSQSFVEILIPRVAKLLLLGDLGVLAV